ncbi:hydroxyphenylacetyl-CoA thioesterase PaaI [Aliiroseovarius subalbicans]|uniref:hydroxyphenylacetyl-CoA thioesterase PaaI n=1 Tax=Aliiroseovarius subalbicans TaxID=2925840 RepID=UPI001F581C50|nr:hydroxyphenylacetyl-CoA thioesterase PaaI [Aliiroseovarius subalbicans]MCI2399449.1 hydroxyphenylacetyl-CoA thioesterase PaaI [Aliiroseovarius subalbicans]
MTPQQRAERASAVMWAGDRASQAAGMTLIAIGPGTATITMVIRPDMTNGHGTAHGGYLFTLADSAFAFACNSYNHNVVAQHTSMTYLSPGREGEAMTATATEVALAGRSGIYDVAVTGEDGRMVAQFRGHSRQISGQHFDEEAG